MLLISVNCQAQVAVPKSQTLRVGALKSGSVNWELKALQQAGFDKQNNIKLEVTELGSVNALLVAIQGGSVDVIVGDWIWVARQYQRQHFFQFYPFSNAAGGLMIRSDSGIKTVTDLAGKNIGVAGGPEGKSWLIFNAYAKRNHGIDLNKQSQVKFVAPPLVNVLLERGQFDASLNFWHFNEKLYAKDKQQKDKKQKLAPLIDLQQALKEMGVDEQIPVIGWIFAQDWAQKNSDLVNRFLKASAQTKKYMRHSDEAWEAIRPLMRADDDLLFERLRSAYISGMPTQFDQSQINAMNELLTILNQYNKAAVQGLESLPDDMFWQQFNDSQHNTQKQMGQGQK